MKEDDEETEEGGGEEEEEDDDDSSKKRGKGVTKAKPKGIMTKRTSVFVHELCSSHT